ncbi:serine carboxypeptidase s28 [Paramyrothecium foliicola]|nr:serine carboxypeptidase s28 [Paramyrothecium foliicola]
MAPAKRLMACAAGALLAASPALALMPFNLALKHAIREQAKGIAHSEQFETAAAAFAGRPSYNISVPVDHFHNESRYEPHSDESYNLRYWADASHYRPGGPVIVLSAGEFSSVQRLPYLEHGIVSILTKATGGIGVVLEHRYYGTSFPVPDLSVENMRFLTTEQALADTAYFARNVQFAGLEHFNLTAPDTPYIIYGGSYAGAFAALTRKIYPDVYWGGISSSGVTAAIEDYWQYFEAHRLFAPAGCAHANQRIIQVVDSALFNDDKDQARRLKQLFGLEELDNPDFAETIALGLYMMQSSNWDPQEDVYEFGQFCAAITSEALLFSSTAHLLPEVKKIVKLAGVEEAKDTLAYNLLNFIGWTKSITIREMKTTCRGKSVKQCFSRDGQIDSIDLSIGWLRSWSYQTCTEWGYWPSGSGVPEDQLPMVSRALDLKSLSGYCHKIFNITAKPDVDRINKWGGFNFSYPRLAFIDGERDPWRAATPHRLGLPDRKSTVDEPFILVEYGVHHWDENGLAGDASEPNLPPQQVVAAQQDEVAFVKAWLKEFAKQKQNKEAGVADQRHDEVPGEL